MHEFWFDYVITKYGEKAKLCISTRCIHKNRSYL